MKIQIRQGIFETNSSSVHAISIYTSKTPINLPKKVVFETDEFGWEKRKYTNYKSKASYLWTAILENYSVSSPETVKMCKDKIVDVLTRHGVHDVIFVTPPTEHNYYVHEGNIHDYEDYGTNCSIDHSYELRDFLDLILFNEQALLNFLFNDESIIETGNDNSDEVPEVRKDADMSYRKSN